MYPTAYSALDTTECRIQVPSSGKEQRLEFYSGHHSNYVLKYEAVVCITTTKFVWVSGAWAGHYTNPQIAEMSGVLDLIQPTEFVYADTIYCSMENRLVWHIITPIPDSRAKGDLSFENKLDQRRNNLWIRQRRVAVDQAFGRVKKFAVIDDKWRFDLASHKTTFFMLCKLANLHVTLFPN
jgi:hypothetical protein